MEKQTKPKSRKPESCGKRKVTPVKIAFIVDQYLSDNNFSQILSTFRIEVSDLISKSRVQEEVLDATNHVIWLGVTTDEIDDVVHEATIAAGIFLSQYCLVYARHGTRAPTKEKLKELNDLAICMEVLLQDAKEQKLALQKVPTWFRGWKSPWQGKLNGGELISEGEDELYNLGVRTRDKFPQLFNEDYHPDVYAIKATQIPWASTSLDSIWHGAVKWEVKSWTSESRASDILLRFHDCCQNYKEPSVLKLQEPALDEITHALVGRYNLNFTRQDISSLWFLCKQEASLLNITDQACALITPSEVVLLEWTDDLELFILKGYGNALNYQMGVLLLEDVVYSYEKARLRFAHAETLLPFSCLIGLFLEESDFEKIQKEQPLQLPPKPLQRRNWRGIYSCPAKSSSKYFVHVLHNEHPVPMPELLAAELEELNLRLQCLARHA
ncbi:Multiple inositol polyphosphate phosphatase 1 [Camellia lanceoleosa]|uniref:Multiple inositol polyphosphate phosphatase 1 n=1 Tax=Camellia lanceoleosa TaxID=1840588 RepID=A0ACC0GLB3_9ERIC|nr:Multiple inositol polyphosphate phosphatase 1 [Camellia lanceoleosa]